MFTRMTHRIKDQHPAEEVDSFMGRLAGQCVENRKGWLRTKQTTSHLFQLLPRLNRKSTEQRVESERIARVCTDSLRLTFDLWNHEVCKRRGD